MRVTGARLTSLQPDADLVANPVPHRQMRRMITGSQLQDMLVAALVQKAGGTRRRWRIALGPVRFHDASTHCHCNWSLHPSGSPRENAEIEKLLDHLRLAHPEVAPD